MEYISVADAVIQSGKSLSTVRRAIKKLSPDSVMKQGDKHFYKRDVLFKELGVDVQPEPPVNVQVEVQESSVNVHDELVEVLKEQVREQRETIAQLLERLRESNVISNNYQQRLLAIQETKPEPVPEPKNSAWVGWVLVGVLVAMLGIATYVSWRF